jgi:hypothetical protein
VGRPKLPKGEAKGRIVPVRFTARDLKAMESAAKAKDQTLSEWVRSASRAVLGSKVLIQQTNELIEQSSDLLNRGSALKLSSFLLNANVRRERSNCK